MARMYNQATVAGAVPKELWQALFQKSYGRRCSKELWQALFQKSYGRCCSKRVMAGAVPKSYGTTARSRGFRRNGAATSMRSARSLLFAVSVIRHFRYSPFPLFAISVICHFRYSPFLLFAISVIRRFRYSPFLLFAISVIRRFRYSFPLFAIFVIRHYSPFVPDRNRPTGLWIDLLDERVWDRA